MVSKIKIMILLIQANSIWWQEIIWCGHLQQIINSFNFSASKPVLYTLKSTKPLWQ